MSEYMLYMVVPTLLSASIIYFGWIRRLSLEHKLKYAWPFIFTLSIAMYVGAEPGTYLLQPWIFDCTKTIGFCPGGLPIEDLFFAFLIVLNVTWATFAYSKIERQSRSTKEFVERFLFLKKTK